MLELLKTLLASEQFIPHGHCYLWNQKLVGLHIVSDCLIALAYFSIPITLLYFVWKRQDFPFNWMFLLFGLFITSCGTTHLMEIWTLWHPIYWLSGCIKAITALISLYTAFEMVPLVSKALALPSPAQLELANRELEREISERQRMEESLKESQAKYKTLFEIFPIGISITDQAGNLIEANPASQKILGKSTTEQTKLKYDSPEWVYIRPDGTPLPRREFASARALTENRVVENIEKGIVSADSKITWISVTAAPIPLPEYGVAIAYVDITDRQLAEAALRESEKRFRSAFNDAAIGMAMVALDGKWLKVNRSLCESIGYTEQELQSLTVQNITHPDDLDIDLNYVLQVLVGEISTYQMEKRYFHKEEHIIWTLLCVSLVHNDQNQPMYFIFQIQDISVRKRAERELELQSIIVKNMAGGVCLVKGSDKTIVYANPKFESMFGYDPGELNGKVVDVLNYEDEIQNANQTTAKITSEIEKYGEATYRVYNIKKDGTPFWCRAHASLFKHPEHGMVYVAVQEDITEYQRAEASLKAANLQLERLAVIDSLTGIPNRRKFDAHFNLEWRRMAREQLPLSLILCDIDHFKSYNDTYGHLAGDFCLQQVAQAISRSIKRPADLAARYGGEEFAIILPNTHVEGALQVAEATRNEVQNLKIAHAQSAVDNYVTISAGVVSVVPQNKFDPSTLIIVADLALYEAKKQGKNRSIGKSFDELSSELLHNRLSGLSQPIVSVYKAQ